MRCRHSTYIRLAACNIFTILAIRCSLSDGTCSQSLKASINFPLISLPGFPVVNVNGSRMALDK